MGGEWPPRVREPGRAAGDWDWAWARASACVSIKFHPHSQALQGKAGPTGWSLGTLLPSSTWGMVEDSAAWSLS